MSAVSIVFPHQLFRHHPAIRQSVPVYLIEDHLFFAQYKFHKQKLRLHRSSMKYYESYLLAQGYSVTYIEHHEALANLNSLFANLSASGIERIYYADTVDYLLERRIKRYTAKYNLTITVCDTPNFICTSSENSDYFKEHKYFLKDYYVALRKKYNILTADNKPIGEQWTFDTENRKKMPKETFVPPLPAAVSDHVTQQATDYIKQHFPQNPGSLNALIYPTTHSEAATWLEHFLESRFMYYGIYQDAIVAGQNWLFHSILTPMLNVGLLEPTQVIDRAVAYAAEHHIPINSLEGFVRQILGWREYIRAVYEAKGTYERKRNYFEHNRKIPVSFWLGKTGIEPVDDAIKRLLSTGYNHHIERLMILGNFMLLCEFDPDEVYRWFMEMYIDSYDWVMVPNVYGMSQYADGGLMSTKPYISGSNYVMKMSHYSKGSWSKIWDALFWRFIHKHKDLFGKNPRMSMMAVQVSKMDEKVLAEHLTIANDFLATL